MTTTPTRVERDALRARIADLEARLEVALRFATTPADPEVSYCHPDTLPRVHAGRSTRLTLEPRVRPYACVVIFDGDDDGTQTERFDLS